MSGKLEKDFQASVIKEVKERFPGAIVTKLDAAHLQGIPDLLVLYNDRWATLECKKDIRASHRPNQDYYVNRMNEMSFSRFISPENRKDILDEMERSFQTCRESCILKRK